MKKGRNLSEILYMVAFVLWLFVMILNLTYFRDRVQMSALMEFVQYVVLALLLVKLTRDFEFSLADTMGLGLLLLFMFVAYTNGKLSLAVSLALVYSVKNVSFDKVLKTVFVMQAEFFAVTVLCSQLGIIEDYIWNPGWRNRHGLGYTHCLLGSHFILFLSLIMVVLLDQIKIWMAAVILAANYIMYVYTDARTTMILSVAFVALAFGARFLKKRRNAGRICAGLMGLIPMVFFAGSAYITKIYRWDSAWMVKLDNWLNGRLRYAYMAWEEYGMTLFGQRIKWIGESVVKDNPDRIYNYVDNAYMQAFFSYGLVFALVLCAGWGLVLYRRMREGDYIMAAAVLIVLVHGLINPQMIELAYNPFFLLIGYEFARCRGVRIGKEK